MDHRSREDDTSMSERETPADPEPEPEGPDPGQPETWGDDPEPEGPDPGEYETRKAPYPEPDDHRGARGGARWPRGAPADD